MRVLFIDWPCFDREETKQAFEDMGYDVIPFFHEDYNASKSDSFDAAIKKMMERHRVDFVFSYNYFPLVAIACKDEEIPYLSFLYDSPYAFIYSYTLMFDTNYVFLFDSSLADYFQRGGLKNVYYMNLPGVPEKLTQRKQRVFEKTRYQSDVSFVGSLYTEEHNFYNRIDWSKNPYADGYVRGLMDAQKLVSGYNFIEDCLSPGILRQLTELYPIVREEKSIETEGFRFADYVINRRLTSEERIEYLSAIGERLGEQYRIKVFTLDPTFTPNGVMNMGVAAYEDEMVLAFHYARINLNISLRSIKSGIPLRCMDIMSAGGFLLTNFQSDFLIDFVPDEDFVYYDNKEDMLGKIEYYLTHEKERKEIAQNGYEKVCRHFTLKDVLSRMLDAMG